MYFKAKRYPIPKQRPLSVFTKKKLKKGEKRFGIRSKSEFAKLRSFKGCEFFGLDIMHLLSGVAKQLWKIICGAFGKKDNPLFLKTSIRTQIGKAIADSKRTIPSSLDACTKNLFKKKGLKSIEWINMMLYVTPTIIIEHIKDPGAREAVIGLTQVYTIVFQKVITSGDLRKLDIYVWKWLQFLVQHANIGNINEKIFTINQHYLRHLKEITLAMGPPRMYSAFSNERALGEIKRKVRSPSAPGINAGNVMLDLAAKRFTDRLDTKVTNTTKKVLTVLADCNAPEVWPSLWNGLTDDYTQYNLNKLLNDYWNVHLNNLGNINPFIEAGARLFISSKDVIGSSY
ncbi:hypothetical protein BDC45DRAFT_173619 [Circinella umbellata]|nr:hypothetical protein BDC45DRAFT_173619 [Circinella umbellata]